MQNDFVSLCLESFLMIWLTYLRSWIWKHETSNKFECSFYINCPFFSEFRSYNKGNIVRSNWPQVNKSVPPINLYIYYLLIWLEISFDILLVASALVFNFWIADRIKGSELDRFTFNNRFNEQDFNNSF